MRSSGVINVLYVVRKASQYKTRSAEQKQGRKFKWRSEFTAKQEALLRKQDTHYEQRDGRTVKGVLHLR